VAGSQSENEYETDGTDETEYENEYQDEKRKGRVT
jgi:hypothetical protein